MRHVIQQHKYTVSKSTLCRRSRSYRTARAHCSVGHLEADVLSMLLVQKGEEEKTWLDSAKWKIVVIDSFLTCLYLVSDLRKVMMSFLSLGFLRPPKAILVPGMYFFGFSRYSNCAIV